MRAFLYLLLAPLALAQFGGQGRPGGPGNACPTKTVFTRPTATVTKFLTPKTKTVVDRNACTQTITRTYNQRTTVYATTTKTRTVNPTVTAPPRATKTLTQTLDPVTTCSTADSKPKATDIPDDMTNAERLRSGLPLRNPRQRRHADQRAPAKPSACAPTTTTITWGSAPTKLARNTVTSTVTKCAKTKVAYEPAFQTKTGTKTAWATATAGRTVTRPNPSPTTTILVQVTPTHYTGTCDGANPQ